MKGSGALQVDWGVFAVVHTKTSSVESASLFHPLYTLCVCVCVGKSVHAPVVLTALFTVLSYTKAKLSIILLHQPLFCPLRSNSVCLPSIHTCLWFTEQYYNFTSWSPNTWACEHFSCHCFCLVCMCLVFQQKQQGAFCLAKICWLVWWWQCVVRLPSAPSNSSFPLWLLLVQIHSLRILCLEQESSCLHWRDGRWI